MITFKPVVYAHQRRKDGSYNIKIRVTFRCVHRHLPTTLSCYKEDLTRDSLRIKNPQIIAKANEEIRKLREACADLSFFDLEGQDVDFVVEHIKKSLQSRRFALDFFAFGEEFSKTKIEQTAKSYKTAMDALERYLGKRSCDINDITRTMVLGLMQMLDGEKHTRRSKDGWLEYGRVHEKGYSSDVATKLGAIYRAAKMQYNDEDRGLILIPRSPFDNLPRERRQCQGQRNLGVEIIQQMIDDNSAQGDIRAALDAFLLSFCTMGANIADLFAAKPVEGVWEYHRQKTQGRRQDRALMRVYLPSEAQPYIDRLRGSSREWWLGELHRGRTKIVSVDAFVNRGLTAWCEEHGIPRFTAYAARHTWASLARKIGIDKGRVDECLCHIGDFSLVDIYAERDWDGINEANRRVLALFRWHQDGSAGVGSSR